MGLCVILAGLIDQNHCSNKNIAAVLSTMQPAMDEETDKDMQQDVEGDTEEAEEAEEAKEETAVAAAEPKQVQQVRCLSISILEGEIYKTIRCRICRFRYFC